MTFKHGRLTSIWLNGVDISPYFASADLAAKVALAPVTTFTATWDAFLSGEASSMLTAAGYYDSSEADGVRAALLAAPLDQLTYFPAGATAIGDQARLMNITGSDYKTSSKIGNAVVMDWTAASTSTLGIGTCLHVLQSEAPGTVTGVGDGLLTSLASTTGAIAHLHVTAMTGGDTHNFKLQDSTTLGGAYTDIASGAFTAVTAVGSQRLIIPGTIRQFVRAVSTISTHAATFGIAAART